MFGLEGKVALITGGAGSIGLASARLLRDHGARIALVDRDPAALDAALAAMGGPAPDLMTHAADVADESSTKAYVAATLARFGRLDVLFSNAGNFGTVAPIEDYPTETFDAVLAVHVRGAFLAAKHAVPHLQPGASIVITSSVAGLRGDPGVYGYITAKHAQTGLMRVLAKELAPRGIRVNTVNPGPIGNAFQKRVEEDLTGILGRDGTAFFDEIIPMGRHGTPEEIARTVLYLASDLSTFTTGAVLPVDGGMSV
ncbi:SDR family NAD(P)-dependent oxidoreductase [Neotabrizicola shimadae]|uniref:SDR family NAD(P)-dependent oxidoreductase n=1 Tax=Neotabrizicola shimadae TaxID=2807096 RepID=UPI002176C5D7|nr:SDR family NAD(P)-dependent oxidoreductase [Neotabrizicola shimadae]